MAAITYLDDDAQNVVPVGLDTPLPVTTGEVFPAPATFNATYGTLTNTTVNVLPNPLRNGLIISNPSDTVMTAHISSGAPVVAATASIGIPVPAGDSISMTARNGNVPNGAVSLFCAGTSKAYTIYEW